MKAKVLVTQSCPALCDSIDLAPQAPLSMGFSRQEHWSGFPCPPPGDLPHPGIKPVSLTPPALSGGFFTTSAPCTVGLPWRLSGKESICQCRRPRFDPWVGKISWRKAWQTTPVFLPGESHGQRSLAGYSLWDHMELVMTERFSIHAHIWRMTFQEGVCVCMPLHKGIWIFCPGDNHGRPESL